MIFITSESKQGIKTIGKSKHLIPTHPYVSNNEKLFIMYIDVEENKQKK